MKPDQTIEKLETELDDIKEVYKSGKITKEEWLVQSKKVIKVIDRLIKKQRKGEALSAPVPKPLDSSGGRYSG